MTMKDKVQQAVGEARSRWGAATGNRRLEASGRMQRRRAQVTEVAHDLRDRFRGAQVRRRTQRPGDPL
ncbi:CsbD family protein [Amycolatopsis sp. NPDC051061]|uniref:CsbD family protein n=1 Tax=Amycolatopsis sp. NPDC051061 TaxID=3155042 RepID=UPI003436A3F9